MAEHTYRTITQPTEGLFKDKGSKFIAYAFPAVSEDEVKIRLDQIRKEHHAARHCCWAYKLGFCGEQFRCSDDGEPSNSAGRPILGQLEAFGITNVAVVVVRYFGGVLLGVGGLMQAYKESAKDALSQAEVVEKVIQTCFSVDFTYEQNNAIMNILKRYKCNILSRNFAEQCNLSCSVSIEFADDCIESLQKISNVIIANE